MSNQDSTPTFCVRKSYQVDAPPNDLTLGFVACEAYHRESRVMDTDAKLFILPDGRFHLHTSEGTFPVRGWYFTKTATVIESDKTLIIDNAHMGDPDFESHPVEIGIRRQAWNVACNFATDLLLIRAFDPEATFDMPYMDMSHIGPAPTPTPPAPPLIDLRFTIAVPAEMAVR